MARNGKERGTGRRKANGKREGERVSCDLIEALGAFLDEVSYPAFVNSTGQLSRVPVFDSLDWWRAISRLVA